MDVLSTILILLGIGLLVLEIFIPSFGVTGISGIVCILVGVILTASTVIEGVFIFLVIVIITILLMIILYKLFLASKKSPFILRDSVTEEAHNKDLEYFVGKTGIAITPLRPSGTGEFDEIRLDVLSKGEFIKKDARIKIVAIEGKKILVRLEK